MKSKEFKGKLEIGNPEHIEMVREYELKRGYNRLNNSQDVLHDWDIEFEITNTFEEDVSVKAFTEDEAIEKGMNELRNMGYYGYEYEIEETSVRDRGPVYGYGEEDD